MKPFRHQQYSFVKVKLMSRSNYAKNLIVRTLAISLSTGKYIKVLLFQLGNEPYNELPGISFFQHFFREKIQNFDIQ